jgi:hypothetical protein
VTSAFAATALICAFGAAGFGQSTASMERPAPARMAAVAPANRARIRGRVLDSETRQPLRRVRVLLLTTEERPVAATTTDRRGRYELSTEAAGEYRVVADKGGFMPRRYGAGEAGDLGKTLTLRPGHTFDGADIPLSRGCAISGRVADEFGKAVPAVPVMAGVRARRDDGVETFVAIRMAYTDDLGQYRLWGLAPGRFYILAEPSPRSSTGGPLSGAVFAPTYYPGVRALSGARQVDLTTVRERTVDVTLHKVSTASISGTVVDALGRPPGNGTVYLSTRSTDGLSSSGAERMRLGDVFTRGGLTPGDYTLSAAVDFRDGGQALGWGRTRVAVRDKDVADVVVQIHPGATLSGRVVFEGGPAPPMGTIHIVAWWLDLPWVETSRGSVTEDGTFVVTAVYGESLFDIVGVPPGWAVKALIVNGRDVLGRPTAFEGGETIAGASLVLSRHASSVRVLTRKENGRAPEHGAYVAIYQERTAEGRADARQFRPTAGGAATFVDLPAGDYFAFAGTTLDLADDFDTEALAVLRAMGTRFSVREGETKAITVTVIPRFER